MAPAERNRMQAKIVRCAITLGKDIGAQRPDRVQAGPLYVKTEP